ncbi:MAG: NUDIX hydrolase [Simkaniaceae bacterium]|nr:MAG: NUDIX hydrolase [Simkaniaceae bacterium]
MVLKIFESEPKGFIPRVTVVGCYCLYEDKILLLKRSPKSYSGEKWCLPGGKREEGESRLEGAKRELHEECGIDLLPKNLSLLMTLYMEFPDYQYDFSIYNCTFKVEPPLDLDLREHTEALWLSHQEALKLPLIHGGARILEYCLQKHRESPM